MTQITAPHMTDLMFDLETVGIDQTAIFKTVCGIPFNLETGEVDNVNVLHLNIDVDDFAKLGGTITWETIKWWMEQSDEAKKTFIDDTNTVSLSQAMIKLSAWYSELCQANDCDLIVWGNGATFDLGKLKNAFELIKLPTPWKFFKENDVRTITRLNPAIKKSMEFIGTKHDPYYDCLHQIRYVCDTVKSIGGVVKPVKKPITTDELFPLGTCATVTKPTLDYCAKHASVVYCSRCSFVSLCDDAILE